MRLQVIIPLIILLIFSYLIFIFPFEVISSWLGRSTSLQETILSTAFVYLVCLYYFRSKSSNKIVKFFVYEGMGIGTISLFVVIFILMVSLVVTINDAQKIFIFFIIFFPSESDWRSFIAPLKSPLARSDIRFTLSSSISSPSFSHNVKTGDKVVYKKYAGTELTWEDKEYLLVKSEDLQAKVL